jgi:hypothetical protein
VNGRLRLTVPLTSTLIGAVSPVPDAVSGTL